MVAHTCATSTGHNLLLLLFLTLNMAILEDVLREAGFSDKAIAEVKDGKLHYGGSLDAASDKELSVKLAFHVKAKLENAKDIFIGDPKKKVCFPLCVSRWYLSCFNGCIRGIVSA